jgi:lipid-A-disaccharide synthase
MVGLMEKPMVIMYRMNPLTAWFAKRLVTKTKFFGLPNLVLDERVVPELFQEQANPEQLAMELERYILDPGLRAQTVTSLARLKSRLGERGATVKVARILDEYLR